VPIDTASSLLSFAWPDGEDLLRVWLVPEGEWAVRGGLEPGVNTASIKYTEYASLPAVKQGLIGQVELWLQADPATDEADVVLHNQEIVQVRIERVGIVVGESSPRAIVYRLAFADHRHAWLEPRGGRLRVGIVNGRDAVIGASLTSNQSLAQQCMDAMGLPGTAPAGLSDAEPLRDLDWTFAHAPTELARVLEHCGYDYCPTDTGPGVLGRIGVGTLPTWPAERLIYNLAFDVVDRRPLKLVIASAPSAVVRTYNEEADEPPAWHFVAQDPDDGFKWKRIDLIAQVGADPIDAIRKGLPDASEEHRPQLWAQLFRCIQVDQTRFPAAQCSLLREVYDVDEAVTPAEPQILLEIAVREREGAWVNREVRVRARQVIADAGVLEFEERLLKVDGGQAADLEPHAVNVGAANLAPLFSIEDYADGQRRCALFAYTYSVGVLTAQDEATAADWLTGYRPDVAVLNYPDLRQVVLNDDTTNRATLDDRAKSYARAYVAQASATGREVKLRGFYAVSVDGRLSAVRYDFGELTTTVEVDGWNQPTGATRGRGR
jgi:hypothetical protein